MIKRPKSKFIKVRCPKCKNEQIIFGNASDVVKCLVCDKEICPGEKVIVSMPELIFIHLSCVLNEDHARELIRQHKESQGE